MEAFEDDFAPIKKLSREELRKDPFLLKLSENAKVSKLARQQKRIKQQNFILNAKLHSRSTENDEVKPNPLSTTLDDDDDVILIESESDTVSANKEELVETEYSNTFDEVSIDVGESIPTAKQEAPASLKTQTSDAATIRKTIKMQLISQPRILNFTLQYTELYTVMETTVRDREGASTLLIGPRGSGKTSLINKCLSQLHDTYGDAYLTIKLNSFIHSDDNSAIREISTQFTRLSGNDNIESRQLNTTFSNILKILDDQDRTVLNSPIIFVIDDLETFTNGNKQILLYNLFELTQSSKTPICIIGTTTKFTTRELLEKRVRSRFSQRLIVINKLSNYDEFVQSCISNLKLSEEAIQNLQNPSYGEQWNLNIDKLVQEDSGLKRALTLNYNTVRNVKHFNIAATVPILRITEASPFPDDSLFTQYLKNQIPNPVEAIVNSLSNLELLLAMAASRFVERSNLVALNFSIAYQEYVDMIKQFNIDKSIMKSSSVTNYSISTNVRVNTKIWDSSVLKNCWLSLYRMGLLIDYVPNTVEGGVMNASSNKYYVLEDSRMLQVDISLSELNLIIPDSNLFKVLTRL